jgi:hypothetical protein
VTGERTLPILDAAHIQAFAAGGAHDCRKRTPSPHRHPPALRSRLCDRLGGPPFEVSRRLKADFDNGRHYYDLHGFACARQDVAPASRVGRAAVAPRAVSRMRETLSTRRRARAALNKFAASFRAPSRLMILPRLYLGWGRVLLVNPHRGISSREAMPICSASGRLSRTGARVWYDDQRRVHEQVHAGRELVGYAFMGTDPAAATTIGSGSHGGAGPHPLLPRVAPGDMR